MSLSLHEQLKLHIEDPLEFNNIFAHDCWTLEEYKEFFGYVDKGWLVQHDENNGFIVNPEWEDEPLWSPSEEQQLIECDFCGKEEDPDEIISGNNGKGCGECRHLCD